MRSGRWVPILAACAAVLALAVYGCGLDSVTPSFVYNVRLIPDSVELAVGESVTLHIRVFDQDKDSFPDRVDRVEVFSENPAVARVDARTPDAVVVAVAPGRTRIVGHLGYGLGVTHVLVRSPGGGAGPAQVALRKLRMLDAAASLDDLRIPPANRLEKLKGDRTVQYSIRINRQWRLCFVWRVGDAYDVEIVDDH